MSPMTIVVVRVVPPGAPAEAASVRVAAPVGFAASAVAGAPAAVEAFAGAFVAGAVADSAGVVAAAGLAVDCDQAAGETRTRASRRTEIAERRFMAGETIGRMGTRQAPRRGGPI